MLGVGFSMRNYITVSFEMWKGVRERFDLGTSLRA